MNARNAVPAPGCWTRRQLLAASGGLGLGAALAGPMVRSRDVAVAQDGEQVFRYVSLYQPESLAPQRGGHQFMQANVYLPPFYPDADGVLQSGVCNDYSVSDDGLVYTLRVDPNATFSDGSPVTAADIKYSWDMFCRPENEFPNHAYVLQAVLGYQEAVSGAATELAGLRVVDDGTLEITLASPYAPFINMISIYLAGITKREVGADGAEQIGLTPIGAGPYKLESWDRDTHEVVWTPSEYWWGTVPTITEVRHQFVQDANTHVLLYENDEVDAFRPNPAIVTQMQLDGSQELHQAPYSGTWLYCFKAQRAPMDDVNVRRALVKAVEMDPIAEAVFQGTLEAAHGLWPPFSVGYEPRPPQYDPDAARAALAASSYGDAASLPPITLVINPGRPEFVRVAEAMQQMWQDVLGVSVEVLPTREPSDTAQIVFDGQAVFHDDPGVFATDLGHSQGIFLASIVDVAEPIPGLDDQIREADQLPADQVEERVQRYRAVEDTLLDLAFYIPVVPLFIFYAVKPWVQGFAANSSLTLYSLPEMSISGR
jgi:ABC-type transport system substrate-binding protein